MTGANAGDRVADGTDASLARTVTVETTHADAATAATVAASLTPDNTAQIQTTTEETTVRTRIDRETTGGLLSSVDDYLVNLGVADELAATGRELGGDTATATDAVDSNDAAGSRDADPSDAHETRGAHDTDADTHDT